MTRATSKTKSPRQKVSSGLQVSTVNTTRTEALNQAKILADKFKTSLIKYHGETDKPFSKRYASISERVKKTAEAMLSDIAKQTPQPIKIPVGLSIFGGEWGTFFIFSYLSCDAGLTMIVVLYAKTITIRYAGGAASYYCQGERKTTNL